MMNLLISIFFWTSCYFFVVIAILLFFFCSSYNEKPCIATYHREIGMFYSTLASKLEVGGITLPNIFFSDTIWGSCYRHFLIKDFLTDSNKLREIDFTENEIKSINDSIIPGFNERNTLFDMLRAMLFFLTVILGIIVGRLI